MKRTAADGDARTDGGIVASDGSDPPVGRRIREFRHAKGLSLKRLGDRSGLSRGYLSRLENGHLSPTVATLSRIMAALGTPVSAAFVELAHQALVVRRAERPVLRSRGVEDYLLTPTRTGRLEVIETVIAPGQGSGSPPYAHAGDEEAVLVLEGALRMWVDETPYDLEVGDTITFECRRPHRWVNPGDVRTRVIWILTPAGY